MKAYHQKLEQKLKDFEGLRVYFYNAKERGDIMGRIITAKFISGSHFAQAFGNLWQYDYGAKLILEGLELPVAAEIHFASMECGGESETRIGVTTNGITEVKS